MDTTTDDVSHSLIAASKVQGTDVFNPHGEKLGVIDDVIIDKRSGQTAYAVMSFGGFLGLGGDYHPIPWKALKYNASLGGFVADIEPKVLEGSPAYAAGAEPRWGDQSYEESIHRHYGTPPYWGDAWA